MSNIARAFAKGKAFIPFITCGDPDLETTARAVRAMAEAGADLIELGIPFSDPTAEGPVIQEANVRALASGTTTDKIFDLVRDLRRDVAVPMVFMTYANVVFSYGSERFISTCAETGVDGLILPDVPFEEKEEFDPLCKRYGLDLISLVAPTSEDRIAAICREAAGFVYVVSSLGRHGAAHPGQYGPALRRGLWHLHAGAGEKHGGPLRRGHRGQRHRQAHRPLWPGGRALCGGLRAVHEDRSAVEILHRNPRCTASGVSLCF